MLDVEGLNVSYKEIQALFDLSFKVEKNEIVAVLGPNGHGKTTMLKAIAGLSSISSGKIKYNGIDISNYSVAKRVELGIIYVIGGEQLFPNLKVWEHLMLGAFQKHARTKEKENLEFVYELFPRIKERRNQLASTLSGGERQMLAISAGLMSAGSLIMLDEPSFGLAPKLKDEMFVAIQEMGKMGKTILLAEQSVNEAMDIADNIYLIENGNITIQGNKEIMIQDKHLREVFLGM